MQEIYIRLYKASKIHGKPYITIGDIATISGPPKLKEQIGALHIVEPKKSEQTHYIISIIQIIDAIHAYNRDISVQNLGETDAVVDYSREVHRQPAWWEWSKVAFVCLIVFAGTMVAIMAYQTDVSLRRTFQIMYKIFTGEVTDNPVWITIPYSIGMPLGIIIFFNHIGSRKITDDPTPIEVEINAYETQVGEAMIDTQNNKRRGQV